MKVQIKVDDEVWRQAKAHAAMNDMTLGEVVGEALGRIVNVISENRRERSSVASALVKRQANPAALDETTKGRTPGDTVQRTGAAIKGGSTPSTPATPEIVTPMAKCRKCGEPFPVADMVTEPKTGRLFCPDCVENMKNNQ